MTRTGAPPPAMVQAPVMQDNFLLQEVNLRLGEHLFFCFVFCFLFFYFVGGGNTLNVGNSGA